MTIPAERTGPPPAATRRRWLVVFGLIALLALAAAANLAMGAVAVSPGEVISVLARRLGLSVGEVPSFQADAVLWEIRLPRVLLASVVGAALGASGAALQGLFRNPLADPQLLGIGPGASLGAVVALIALGDGSAASVAGGAIGAVATVAVLRRLADDPTPEPSRLVLAGVALGALISAWVGFLVFAVGRNTVPPVEFWLLGSLVGSTWRSVTNALVLTLGALLVLLGSSRSLDLMTLGESEARHLGVDVDQAKSVVLLATAIAMGGAVGSAGVVGFVGLLAPHLLRRFTGPAHRGLIVASALGGAVLVTAADLVARTVASPVEVPVGLVTAVVGGPFFLWLLRRDARRAL